MIFMSVCCSIRLDFGLDALMYLAFQILDCLYRMSL